VLRWTRSANCIVSPVMPVGLKKVTLSTADATVPVNVLFAVAVVLPGSHSPSSTLCVVPFESYSNSIHHRSPLLMTVVVCPL
jgi:hypothetical protein